jgi:aminoglycoside 6'-N-acetyltransferase I
MVAIRHITREDAAAWAILRHDLWPEASVIEHAAEIAQFFLGTLEEPLAVVVADVSGGDQIIGFAELSVRRKVPGCRTDRVGFVEGLYVVPSWRLRGVGRQLLRAGRAWARQIGCTEFATDRARGIIVDRHFGGVA